MPVLVPLSLSLVKGSEFITFHKVTWNRYFGFVYSNFGFTNSSFELSKQNVFVSLEKYKMLSHNGSPVETIFKCIN